ncbi:MAG TPA: type II/IV secretion system protein, partial [Phycisphaerales bacterium]|nr:type II/IV secretion system protein [Phycisphaerales bacterium]
MHIEPDEHFSSVRFRIDGELREVLRPRQEFHPAIISRIKVMARMDIAEHRLPQDGRICVVVDGRQIDLRVSTLPTVLGEKAVLRVLDRESVTFELSQLGFREQQLAEVRQMLAKPYGLVLVTGPTGSGKTTTLYSAIELIKSVKRNIVTVEDPVEYQLKRINQVHANTGTSLTFARALRSILRQDPDVIMIGEIRDEETAEIAIQAALTGHLVLSTLHTNDAASAVMRLVDMGVAP